MNRTTTGHVVAPLSMIVERCDDGSAVLRMGGSLDADGGRRLLRLLDGILHPLRPGGPPSDVVHLDLTEVGSFDRAGVASMRHAWFGARTAGAHFRLVGGRHRSPGLRARVARVLGDRAVPAAPRGWARSTR